MISENGYMDLMRNCIKWNSRQMEDRKKRLRFPYYEHQTATAQREARFATRTADHAYSSNDPNCVMQFSTERWKKSKSHQPSDAIEMNMFLRENPSIQVAIDHLTPQAPTSTMVRFAESVSDNSNDSTSARPSRQTQIKEEYREDYVLDDELSPEEFGSDEDEWSTRGKRRKGHMNTNQKGHSSSRKKVPTTRSSASRSTPSRTVKEVKFEEPEEKMHQCDKCDAKYKSLAGLSYHQAYLHDRKTSNSLDSLLSPSVDISTNCDFCNGTSYMNKNSRLPEDLVSCHDCGRSGHPSCMSFNQNVTMIIKRSGWQCLECKSCTICGTSENDDKLLFCDDCDRGYHLYCLNPPLEKAPDDEYSCRLCQIEFGDKASAPAKK
ncbi:hypothetical protein L5515_003543 [Caenorhabditis briggsae]|uniref:PHD-type domain-containing protein n=1 Tax=Caenorhabditis briggsae TaxID=6238 RepID=A0AAE9EF42_CAEBR|nr:hypothetical protein L5515_003543 [Caenorhabditis briggsae]